MSTRAQRKATNLAKQPAKSKKTAETASAPKIIGARASEQSQIGQQSKQTVSPQLSPKEVFELPGDRVVEAEFEAGAMQIDQFPPPTFSEIAFAGRSNVGKSSLMNCLTGRKSLVRTSSTPGCTRQVSWFRTTSDDKSIINLIDLPGYGYAKRSKSERKHWATLIETYLLERPTLRGVVLLIDIRRGFEPDDLDLLKMLQSPARTSRAPLEVIVAATKVDKLGPTARRAALLALSKSVPVPVVGFSSHTGEGRTPLWRLVRDFAQVGLRVEELPPVVPSL